MSMLTRSAGALLALSLAMPVLPVHAISSSSVVSDDAFASYSAEQLESLIARLQKRLVEVKAGTKCFVADKDLSLGDGEEGIDTDSVRRLQEFLKEKGYVSYKSTGYYGKMTRAAVIAFQKANGIAQTGEFDAATREKAHSNTCKTALLKKDKGTEQKKKEEPKKEEKKETASVVRSIALRSEGNKVFWKVDGKSGMGFKLVWSQTPTPVYPLRENDQYQYFDSPEAGMAELKAFAGEGIYYVRVCEYLGGSCGVYSNELKIAL